MGAQRRFNAASKKAAMLEQEFNAIQSKAHGNYCADEYKGNMTYKQWASQNVGKPRNILLLRGCTKLSPLVPHALILGAGEASRNEQ